MYSLSRIHSGISSHVRVKADRRFSVMDSRMMVAALGDAVGSASESLLAFEGRLRIMVVMMVVVEKSGGCL